jgi:hypothetical protein
LLLERASGRSFLSSDYASKRIGEDVRDYREEEEMSAFGADKQSL